MDFKNNLEWYLTLDRRCRLTPKYFGNFQFRLQTVIKNNAEVVLEKKS